MIVEYELLNTLLQATRNYHIIVGKIFEGENFRGSVRSEHLPGMLNQPYRRVVHAKRKLLLVALKLQNPEVFLT